MMPKLEFINNIYISELEDGTKGIFMTSGTMELLTFITAFHKNHLNRQPITKKFNDSVNIGFGVPISDEAYDLFHQEWFRMMISKNFGVNIIDDEKDK